MLLLLNTSSNNLQQLWTSDKASILFEVHGSPLPISSILSGPRVVLPLLEDVSVINQEWKLDYASIYHYILVGFESINFYLGLNLSLDSLLIAHSWCYLSLLDTDSNGLDEVQGHMLSLACAWDQSHAVDAKY